MPRCYCSADNLICMRAYNLLSLVVEVTHVSCRSLIGRDLRLIMTFSFSFVALLFYFCIISLIFHLTTMILSRRCGVTSPKVLIWRSTDYQSGLNVHPPITFYPVQNSMILRRKYGNNTSLHTFLPEQLLSFTRDHCLFYVIQ